MGAEHRPPLYAFLVVAIVGGLVMVYAARSEAFRDSVRERTVVVAGAVLDRAVGDPTATAEPAAPAEPAAASDRASRPGAGQRHPAAERGRRGVTEREHDRRATPAPGRSGEAHGPGHGRAHAPGHGAQQAPGRALGHHKARAGKARGHSAPSPGHSRGRGEGHRKHH